MSEIERVSDTVRELLDHTTITVTVTVARERTVLFSLVQQNFMNENQTTLLAPMSSRSIALLSERNWSAAFVTWYRES